MFIKTFKAKKIYIILSFILIVCLLSVSIYAFSSNIFIWSEEGDKSYIKWVDFTPTYEVLNKTSKLDIDSHVRNEEIKYNWIEILSYLACKNGGNFKKFKESDLTNLIQKLKEGNTIDSLSKDFKNYDYYYESYDAVLHSFIGEYDVQVSADKADENTYVADDGKYYTKKYGIKAFLPIAKNYSFNHYKDYGNSRSYGYKRVHLGNDLMGSIGTPIIAVESGVIEVLGWNQYGGWRIGIRSFDKKRYYYYAHLRKNHPYVSDLKEGQIIKAGDVIGYLGMTGYSTKENVNNINVPHLHFGIQLIFNDVQKDGTNQIWIDVYQIIEFLKKNQSDVYKPQDSNEFTRKYEFIDPDISKKP